MRVRRSASGIAIVELVFLLFILGMILWGTTDFARLFYAAIKVTDGARAGAAWGVQSNGHTADGTGIEEKAGHNAKDLAGFTTTSTPKCWCDDGTAVDDCTTGVCPGDAGGLPQVWVEVHAEKTFEMLVNFPGIPYTVPLGQYTRMRVQ